MPTGPATRERSIATLNAQKAVVNASINDWLSYTKRCREVQEQHPALLSFFRYEGMLRDITDAKKAGAAIAESQRRLREVIDTVPAVINVKDRELRYVLMNRYMAGIFGIEPQDAIGRTTGELMSRYGAAKTDENDKRVLAAGKELGFYEEEYRDSFGQMRQWLVGDGKIARREMRSAPSSPHLSRIALGNQETQSHSRHQTRSR